MPYEGRLKIGSDFLKIGSNYLRIGPAPSGFTGHLVYANFAFPNHQLVGLTEPSTEFVFTSAAPNMDSFLVGPDNTFYLVNHSTGQLEYSTDLGATLVPGSTDTDFIYYIIVDSDGPPGNLWVYAEDAVSSDQAIWLSTDRGATLIQMYDLDTNGYSPADNPIICINPQDHTQIVASALDGSLNFGVLKSTDSGATWTFHQITAAASRPNFTDAAMQWLPDGSLVVVALDEATLDVRFWRSTDSGSTWTNTMTLTPTTSGQFSVISNVCFTTTAGVAFFIMVFQDPSHVLYQQVYRTADGGATWTDVLWPAAASSETDIFGVAYDEPNDALYIYTGPTGSFYKAPSASTASPLVWTHLLDDASVLTPYFINILT